MKKDIRNIISEAFEELYQEIVNEAPETLKKSIIGDNEIQSMIKNATEKGTPIPYNFAKEDKKSQDNFNTIIDALVDNYKTSGNPNTKKSLQATFYPMSGSKMYRAIGSTYLNNPDMEDAAASAYEQVVINNFDKVMNAYQSGTRGLSAMLMGDMKNKVYNYIVKGHRGAEGGGSQLDVMTGGEEMGGKPTSLDAPIGGEEGGDDYGSRIGDAENAGEEKAPDTFGGQLATALSTGPQTAMEKGFEKEKKIANQREIIKDVISWLDNTFEESGDEMGKKRMIAFKGLMAGDSPEEIFEENPGVFANSARVTEEFGRLVTGREAQEISKIISNIYGIKFDLANIDPKKLKQFSSMKPEFGGFSKQFRTSTPEMKEAQKELNNILGTVGLKGTDFDTDAKKERVISNLQAQGKEAELEAILSADDHLSNVTEKAKALGQYTTNKVALLPSTAGEESEAGEMFEGFDMDKLMERVYKRLLD